MMMILKMRLMMMIDDDVDDVDDDEVDDVDIFAEIKLTFAHCFPYHEHEN